MCRQWNQGCITWEEYRFYAWMCKYEIRKAKTHLKLHLVKGNSNNNNSFYRMAKKGRLKKTYYLLVNKTGQLVTNDMKKAEVLNNFFLAQFLMIISLPTYPKLLKLKKETGGIKAPITGE